MLIKPLTFLDVVVTWCYWTFQNLNVSHDIGWIELGERGFVKRKRNQREFLKWTFLGLCDPRNHKWCGSGVKGWQMSRWGMCAHSPDGHDLRTSTKNAPCDPNQSTTCRLRALAHSDWSKPGEQAFLFLEILSVVRENVYSVSSVRHWPGRRLVRCHGWGGEKKGVFND